MSWVKLDDNALDNPRFLTCSRGARLLHLEALAWNARHAGDGTIRRAAVARVTDEPDPGSSVDELVEAGIWLEDAGILRFVWLLDDQLSPDEVERRKGLAKERQRRLRDRTARHAADDHSLCDRCSFVTRDKSRESRVTNAPPTRPVPSRPGTEEETETGAGAAIADAAGLAPVVAAAPANVRWLPVRDDDYADEPWRDDYGLCERCNGYFPIGLFPDEDEYFMCPACSQAVKRRRGQDCFAFTVAKKDEPSRPCRQKRPTGSIWCKYHARDESRGQAPPDRRLLIDRDADEAIAKLPAIERPGGNGVSTYTGEPVACTDYLAHQSQHRLVGDAWSCEACTRGTARADLGAAGVATTSESSAPR